MEDGCKVCGRMPIYAENLCYRCYKRLQMREYRRRKKSKDRKQYTTVVRSIRERFENLGLECPHCKNTAAFYVDFEHAEIICKICGLVLVKGYGFNMFFPERCNHSNR